MEREEELRKLEIKIKLNNDYIVNLITNLEDKLHRKLNKSEVGKVLLYSIGYVEYDDEEILQEILESCDII